jgi:hypothetical protein
MYTTLPINEAIFDFEHVGQTTGYEYKGTFKVKCVLTVADRHRQEVEKTQMSADFQNPSASLSVMSTVLASLRVRIMDAPEWWQQSALGASILDDDCLYALYDKAIEEETKWKEKVKPVSKPKEKEAEPQEEGEGN